MFPEGSTYRLSPPLTSVPQGKGTVPVLFTAPCSDPQMASGKHTVPDICWISESQTSFLNQFVLSPAAPVFPTIWRVSFIKMCPYNQMPIKRFLSLRKSHVTGGLDCFICSPHCRNEQIGAYSLKSPWELSVGREIIAMVTLGSHFRLQPAPSLPPGKGGSESVASTPLALRWLEWCPSFRPLSWSLLMEKN